MKMLIDKYEIASEILGMDRPPVDCALPLNWTRDVTRFLKAIDPIAWANLHISQHFVWSYDQNDSIVGRPLPIDSTGDLILSLLARQPPSLT